MCICIYIVLLFLPLSFVAEVGLDLFAKKPSSYGVVSDPSKRLFAHNMSGTLLGGESRARVGGWASLMLSLSMMVRLLANRSFLLIPTTTCTLKALQACGFPSCIPCVFPRTYARTHSLSLSLSQHFMFALCPVLNLTITSFVVIMAS